MRRITGLLLLISLALPIPASAAITEVVPPVTAPWWRLPVIPEPNWLPGHRGLDFRINAGSPVRSPVNATVSFVGEINCIPIISLTDALGRKHSLLPVTTKLTVGDPVQLSEYIGKVSKSNHCAIDCLHWGVRFHGRYLDPRWLLANWLRRLPIHARG